MRLIGLIFLAACGAFAQPARTFDVASVKLTPPNAGAGGRGGMMGGGRGGDVIVPTPGGVTMTNIRLKSALQWAYHMQTIQIVGPAWLDSDRFDILAKSSGPAETDELRLMMQALLADRFKMAVHKETRDMPAYVVTVAKGGHKLKASDCDTDPRPQPSGNRLAGAFTHVSLEQLSQMVASPLGAVVVDQTGLKGCWDFNLDLMAFARNQSAGMDDPINVVIQAVAEQLGLKIEMKKIPAEVVVVDHAERIPVEN